MALFTVHVIIENKPGISDPEGETILNDLVLKWLNVLTACNPVQGVKHGKRQPNTGMEWEGKNKSDIWGFRKLSPKMWQYSQI